VSKVSKVLTVSLEVDQILTLWTALDSWLYESAPDDWRNDGGVLDPRLCQRDLSDEDDRAVADEVIDLIDQHDAIEKVLRVTLAAAGELPT